MAKLRKRAVNLYIDGGMIGTKNPAPGVFWSVGRELVDGSMEMWAARTESYQHHTNNEAEYLALIEALDRMTVIRVRPGTRRYVVIHSDSQLIVNQVVGTWRCEFDHLRKLRGVAVARINWLAEHGYDIELTWVRRQENVKRLGH